MVDVCISGLPFHDFALFGTQRPQTWALATGEATIEGVDGFTLHQFQMAMESTPQMQSVRLHTIVAQVTQHTMMTFWPEKKVRFHVLLREHDINSH